MASNFKRYVTTDFGTTPTVAYTVPENMTAVIIGMMASNKLDEEHIRISVKMAGAQFIRNVPIPIGASLSLLDGKMVLVPGDVIEITADRDNAGDLIVSVMELG